MKRMGLRFAIVAGVLATTGLGVASARESTPTNTDWCAIYRTGSESCNYRTQDQCIANVSGVGGFCRMSYYSAEAKRHG